MTNQADAGPELPVFVIEDEHGNALGLERSEGAAQEDIPEAARWADADASTLKVVEYAARRRGDPHVGQPREDIILDGVAERARQVLDDQTALWVAGVRGDRPKAEPETVLYRSIDADGVPGTSYHDSYDEADTAIGAADRELGVQRGHVRVVDAEIERRPGEGGKEMNQTITVERSCIDIDRADVEREVLARETCPAVVHFDGERVVLSLAAAPDGPETVRLTLPGDLLVSLGRRVEQQRECERDRDPLQRARAARQVREELRARCPVNERNETRAVPLLAALARTRSDGGSCRALGPVCRTWTAQAHCVRRKGPKPCRGPGRRKRPRPRTQTP